MTPLCDITSELICYFTELRYLDAPEISHLYPATMLDQLPMLGHMDKNGFAPKFEELKQLARELRRVR
jgi:hypothetical protein